MPLLPQTVDEQGRAHVVLAADQVIRLQTRSRREVLLAAFNEWLLAHACSGIDTLLEARDIDAEYIAELLVSYGKEIYFARKPYGRYSEAINVVAGRRLTIRKSLVAAWDLAFSWVTDEPGQHHPAMPLAVVLALSAVSLLWGWPHRRPFCSSLGVGSYGWEKSCRRAARIWCYPLTPLRALITRSSRFANQRPEAQRQTSVSTD